MATLSVNRSLADGFAEDAPGEAACKICGGSSPLFGVVDFHKSCIEAQGQRLPLSGVPVYYRMCSQCRFTFSDAFDSWASEDFRQWIYNAGYAQVDPDYVPVRPAGNARLVAASFEASRKTMRILDFGGGSGLLAEKLRGEGFTAATYDPFSSFESLPEGHFDLVTCFEVMEHAPFPKETVATMVSFLAEGGAILFSTLILPAAFEKVGLQWWYASPRNGHVSLYSSPSLARLFAPHKLRVASFTEGLHIAYGKIPPFAAHLKLPA